MSANEELQEHAHHAQEPFDKMVAVTMAIIAAILATVSVVAHIYANEELLAQQQASDQWAFYQAKSSRRYASDVAMDTLKALDSAGRSEAAATLVEKYEKNAARYEKEGEEIQNEAKKLEAESKMKGKQSLRMEMGEVFLELGIVFASLAILSKRRPIWVASMLCAALGAGVALTAAFV
jgi:Domain of unknown function (DUF4337)